MSKSEIVVKGLIRIPTGLGNAYIISSGKKWVLVDTGTPGNAKNIINVAKKHFGRKARPQAIVLTHGHFDHSGSGNELARNWDVPIYAHRLEIPFVDGTSQYPPPDPTVGGFMSQMIRFMPIPKINLSPHLEELSPGKLKWIDGWQVIETPGHTAGHVSFLRKSDRTLIAGDAFTTVNQDSPIDMLTQRRGAWRPPVYYTSDWEAAEESVQELADLEPQVLAAGHGVPITSSEGAEQLRELADNFPVPSYGRYVQRPAISDEDGIVELPPPVPDPAKRAAVLALAAAGVTGAALWTIRKRAA
jgi:glyoxylase-like metal-dependent hydrolase (beta-lactamase superfamily II)